MAAAALMGESAVAPETSGSNPTERGLPGWPVLALLAGLPVWWVLGVLPFILLPFGLLMAGYLLRLRKIRIVPGVLPWCAFVAWSFMGVLMLDSPDRMLGFSLRFGQFVGIAVLLVYVVNASDSLPLRRVLKALTAVWLTTIVGGWLALTFGAVVITTPMSQLIPPDLLANDYVRDLVIPNLAQVDQPWGSPVAFVRPAAPFSYANSWGAAMAILTPIAFAAIAFARTRRAKLLLVVCVLLALPPAYATLNRGMLLAFGVALAYGLIRLSIRGKLTAILGLFALVGAVLHSVLVGTLTQAILARQEVSNTTEGRARLYVETFQRTLDSPLIGWGSPRPSHSLDVSVGTQGHIWFLMFSFGFVGLALFLLFLVGIAARTADIPGTGRLWLHTSLIAVCVLIFFYGVDPTMHAVVATVAATLLRDKYLAVRRRGETPYASSPTIGRGGRPTLFPVQGRTKRDHVAPDVSPALLPPEDQVGADDLKWLTVEVRA